MWQFFAGFISGGATMFALFVWFFVRDTPRACKRQDCPVNTWSESGFCSTCELDEYEEEHGRGARPGR